MELVIRDIEHIDDVARQFVAAMGGHKVFAFYGAMGAGKTTFIRALCQELGVMDTVASPTFAIVNEYRTASHEPVFHFDFYRLRRIEEAADIGLEDYLYSGHICFIEWPELVEPLLPADTVCIHLTADADSGQRRIVYST